MRTPKVVLAALIVIALAAVTWYALMGHERVEDTRQVTVVAQRLNTPWSIVFYGDTGLVSSRDTGEVLEVQPGGAVRVAGVVEGATHRGEGGLLGLAVGEDSRLYAYHTTAADNRIIRFTLESGSDGVKLGEPEVVIEGLPSASIHNGGRIDFGPDGMLYVAVGDAGDAASAQDITKLSGKILRMTPDGGVPDDNPFADSLVYSYGHRNVQGLAWTDEGTMYATEFGQNEWDELNRIIAGANYGWPFREGAGGSSEYEQPVQQWRTSQASPSGMAFVDGSLYIANLRGQLLRQVSLDDVSSSHDMYAGVYGRIRDVALAPDGSIWFATNNTDGRGTPGADDDQILSFTPR